VPVGKCCDRGDLGDDPAGHGMKIRFVIECQVLFVEGSQCRDRCREGGHRVCIVREGIEEITQSFMDIGPVTYLKIEIEQFFFGRELFVQKQIACLQIRMLCRQFFYGYPPGTEAPLLPRQ